MSEQDQIPEYDPMVCVHLELSKQALIKIIEEKGLTTLRDVMEETDAASVCGSCIPRLAAVLEEVLEKKKK